MMERRRALTIPFVDKEKLMENPLKISVACLSSECGKLEAQVPWTAFSDCKLNSCNSSQKKGVKMSNHTILKCSDILRRKPRLILRDVLKTELGKDYIKRIKMSKTNRWWTSPRKDNGWRKEEDVPFRETRSNQSDDKSNKSKNVTPKQRTSTSQRPTTRNRKPQNTEAEANEESQDIKEVIIGKVIEEKDETFAEVVDCGMSLSWEPAGDTSASEEISTDFTIDNLTGSEDMQHSLKRKRKDPGLQCNGMRSPKRQRDIMLFQTEEEGKDGEQVPMTVGPFEDSEDDVDLENIDRCIVQFTVGGEDVLEPLSPVIPEGIIFSNKLSLLAATETRTSDPIVLSSDDEENDDDSKCRSELVGEMASEVDAVIYRNSSKEAAAQQEKALGYTEDMQVLQLLIDENPPSPPGSPACEVDYSSLSVPFLSMYCGCYKVKSAGGLKMSKHKIIIPLKGTGEQLTFERKELRRYSVWDQQELEGREIHFGDEDPSPPGVMMFFVSEAAAAAIHQELYQLCASEDRPIDTGKASPFILLTLKDPLEGMEGALLRSVLDIDCINRMTHENSIANNGVGLNSLLDIDTPVISMDESIELITRTGVDSHLLSILGIKSSDSDASADLDSSHYEDELPTAHIWVDTNCEKDVEQDPDMAAEDGETEAEPKEDQEDEEPNTPSDSKKEEARPVYTVCHHRKNGSYSVSLCKPDSKWSKYKHRGLTQRLIQFPPPPLKGGITVTLEDLQCLDSGQYLNDVIIDFYLKYLIQNASAAISKRSHIFSSFFYKQLTRRDNASEGGNNDSLSCQRQRRHQRVKTWTRHVDIFDKDFLFVPVNQEAHWYLVVVCFPGLEEPQLVDWLGESEGQDEAQQCKNSNDHSEILVRLDPSDMETETENSQDEVTKDPPSPCPVSCTEHTCLRRTVCRRPCILIMDSLKLSSHERICKLLREYLQSEWEVRRGSSKEFGLEQMKSSHCQVPLQDNSSDCGLYLLQYVECFLKDPVVHFDLPLQLQKWFSRQVVRKKRDEIRNLILNIYRHQNLDSKNT